MIGSLVLEEGQGVPPQENVIRLTARHFPEIIPPTEKKPDCIDVAVCAMPAQRPAKIPDITAARAPANLDCALKAF